MYCSRVLVVVAGTHIPHCQRIVIIIIIALRLGGVLVVQQQQELIQSQWSRITKTPVTEVKCQFVHSFDPIQTIDHNVVIHTVAEALGTCIHNTRMGWDRLNGLLCSTVYNIRQL